MTFVPCPAPAFPESWFPDFICAQPEGCDTLVRAQNCSCIRCTVAPSSVRPCVQMLAGERQCYRSCLFGLHGCIGTRTGRLWLLLPKPYSGTPRGSLKLM